MEISNEFIKWNVNMTFEKSSDVQESKRPQEVKVLLQNKEVRIYSEERAYLMENRPKYSAGLEQTVWNNAKKLDGGVQDPNPPHEKLEWDKKKSRYDQWHMGHKPAFKYSKLVDKFIDDKISWEEFIKEYNKADNYYPELPAKNMSHGYEAEPKTGI